MNDEERTRIKAALTAAASSIHDGHDAFDGRKLGGWGSRPVPFADCHRRLCTELREAIAILDTKEVPAHVV